MIYFLSDAHLGTRVFKDPYEHERLLIQALNEMKKDATQIFLLGDIFDFWYEYLWHDKSKRQYTALMRTLNHMKKRGIEVHFFKGNHDIWTFGGLHEMTGMRVHSHARTMELNGKSVYMAHGDGLIPKDFIENLPWKQRIKIKRFIRLRNFFHNHTAQALFRLMPPSWGNAIGYNWAYKSRLKELQHPCPYKGEDKEELVVYSKEMEDKGPHRDYYIYGHRHIALDLQIRKDSRVIILGDFFKQWTYAKMDEKGNIELCTLEPSNLPRLKDF